MSFPFDDIVTEYINIYCSSKVILKLCERTVEGSEEGGEVLFLPKRTFK